MKKKSAYQKPVKEWAKKWFADGISNTLFVFVYRDHINWCLHEDAPWKDTLKTELDQDFNDYRINGLPRFVHELFGSDVIEEIKDLIDAEDKRFRR